MCPGKKFQGSVTLLLLIIMGPILCHSQTSLKIIDSPSPVEGILGESVTIPCVLTDTKQPLKALDLNLTTDSVRWDRKSLDGSSDIVHLFTQGKSTQSIQRSNIEGKEFKRGIASLTLYNVQRSDEGEYICNLYVGGNKFSAARTLEVSAKPVVNLSSHTINIEVGKEQSVTCFVHKFYPESVKIRWEKFSVSSEKLALDKETCTSVPTATEDGTFNVTSLMLVKPSSVHENGDNYSCIVSHRSLKSERAVYFTVTVKDKKIEPTRTYAIVVIVAVVSVLILAVFAAGYFLHFRKVPPKIRSITGLRTLAHDKISTLSWMVSDFRPNNIEINAYLKRGDMKQKIQSWEYPSPQLAISDEEDSEGGDAMRLLRSQHAVQSLPPWRLSFTYSCPCSIQITPDKRKDKDAELLIEVKHSSLKSALTETVKLNIKGDYFTSHIISSSSLIHGDEVALTCNITKCEPGRLFITWLKGKNIICKDGTIKDTRYTYKESSEEAKKDCTLMTSSSLMFKAHVKEDDGVKYTCKVTYTKIDKILARHLDTSVTAQPVLDQISSRNVDQKMQLFCRIHSFYPKTINIKWYKEGEELPLSENELTEGEDHLYSTTSILTFTPEPEDIGKIFTCEVDHQSLKRPETRKWNLKDPNDIKKKTCFTSIKITHSL